MKTPAVRGMFVAVAAALSATAAVAAELPEEYVRVGFVETRGNQWIDTDYYPGPQTSFAGDLRMVGDYDASGITPFGASDGNEVFCGNFADAGANFYFWRFSAGSQPQGSKSKVAVDFCYSERITLAFDAAAGSFSFGESKLQSVLGGLSETMTAAFGIGGLIQASEDPQPFKSYNMRIYGWKIWTGDVLERDYVPCVRKKDKVAGLYDLQNGVFNPSAGDPFFAGSDGGNTRSFFNFPGGTASDCISFDYRPELSNFSASAWVKGVTPGYDSGSGVIFSQGAISGRATGPGFACGVSGSDGAYSLFCQVRLSGSDAKEVITDWTDQAQDGKWHLVTVTYDKGSGVCCLYVDAELKGSVVQSTATPVSEQCFVIGARSDGAIRFPVKGSVAEVSLWGRVLNAKQVKKMLYGPLTGKEPELLGYWPLDGDATDCVDNGSEPHDGSIGGNVLKFDGSEINFRPSPGMAILLF